MLDKIIHLDHLYRAFTRLQLRYWDGHPQRSRFTPGADGQTLPAFAQDLDANLHAIARDLAAGQYRFSPFVERQVTLAGGRTKRFCQGTLRDTLTQRTVAAVVAPALDARLPDCLHAFRRRRPGGPGLHRALNQSARASRAARYWVVQEDIHAYFDHIRPDHLLTELAPLLADEPRLLDFYTAYLEAPRLVAGEVLPREVGLPIGTPLANLLANLYLLPLDRALSRMGLHYLRYCDDLLVFTDDQETALEAQSVIREMTAQLGLTLNPTKGHLLPPGAPFTYLGYSFEGEQMRIGPRALAKFRRKIKQITARKRWPRLRPADLDTPKGRALLARLLREVNHYVAGDAGGAWARYFARADFVEQFAELDHWTQGRVRAALLHRWRESDARYLPAEQLRDLGLRSLVGEYWYWRTAWGRRSQTLLARAASLRQLRGALDHVRAQAWDAWRREYRFRPGSDGVTLDDFAADERQALLDLQARLLTGEYRFGAFTEYDLVRQGRETPRRIARPGLPDAIVARALAETLAPALDCHFPAHVHAYRPGRGDFTATAALRHALLAQESPWVVRVDVAGYLDHVDLPALDALLDTLLPAQSLADGALRDVLRSYLWSSRWREDAGLLPRERGLPRGGALTPLLGNLALLPLDRALAAASALAEAGIPAVRYADDVVAVAPDAETAEAIWNLLQRELAALGLPPSAAKSAIHAPGEPFEFLSYRITGQRFDVRPYALNRLKRRVRRITQRRKWRHLSLRGLETPEGRAEVEKLIRRVNRLLVYGRGRHWVRRFARCSDDATFRELDAWIADRVRACVTHRWTPRNRRVLPAEVLEELGLVSLAELYYHEQRRIAGQAARAALQRRAKPSPEAA